MQGNQGNQGDQGNQGGLNFTFANTAPLYPVAGDYWFDSDNGILFVYLVDQDSSQWVETAGTEGLPGFQGAIGSQGFQGNIGYQGNQGSRGYQGYQGTSGSNGFQGNQGYQGNNGSNGSQGNQGLQGYQGTSGSNGSQGNQGYQGTAGSNGSQGNQGNQGSQGTFSGSVTFTEGTSIPSAANIDDYNLPSNSFFKISGATSSNINGFANGVSGLLVVVVNNTNKNQTFVQEATSSSASNRFVLGSANKTIGVNGTATFIYVTGLTIGGVGSQSRWVLTANT